MVKLFEFLAPEHELRANLPKPKKPLKKLPYRPGPVEHKGWVPLFLTTVLFLSRNRTLVTQDFAGETPAEVVSFLTPKFTASEMEELIKDIPVESQDGQKQYLLEPKRSKSELGNQFLKPTGASIRKQERIAARKAAKLAVEVQPETVLEEPTMAAKPWNVKLKEQKLKWKDMSKAMGSADYVMKLYAGTYIPASYQLAAIKKLGAVIPDDMPTLPQEEEALRMKRRHTAIAAVVPPKKKAPPAKISTHPYQVPDEEPAPPPRVSKHTMTPIQELVIASISRLIKPIDDEHAMRVMQIVKLALER